MFMILISIKEVIDDNIIEVSNLKAQGYDTYSASKLILSPYLILTFIAFIIFVPVILLTFIGLNQLFLNLFLLDLTFKLI